MLLIHPGCALSVMRRRASRAFVFVSECGMFFLPSENMIEIEIISSADFEKLKKRKVFMIHYGFHKSPFGRCLLGLFQDKICHVSFVNALDCVNLNVLKSQWPGSTLIRDQKLTMGISRKIFESETELFNILVKGTPFEAKVWKALMRIPKGETASYEDVAVMAGHNRAVRAAANAVAKNSVSYLIPCHRVIKKDGSLHKYQWGTHIKSKILQFESNC